jgi:hypothetical protein
MTVNSRQVVNEELVKWSEWVMLSGSPADVLQIWKVRLTVIRVFLSLTLVGSERPSWCLWRFSLRLKSSWSPLDKRRGVPQSACGRYGEENILDPIGTRTLTTRSSCPKPVAIRCPGRVGNVAANILNTLRTDKGWLSSSTIRHDVSSLQQCKCIFKFHYIYVISMNPSNMITANTFQLIYLSWIKNKIQILNSWFPVKDIYIYIYIYIYLYPNWLPCVEAG